MSEDFDDELSKHITDVFDQYEDTAPAQEGWLLLRQKFPPQKRRRVIPLWWSVAASLLIVALFGLWYYNTPQQPKSTMVKTRIKKQPADTLIQHRTNTSRDQWHPSSGAQSANKSEYAAIADQKTKNKRSSNTFDSRSTYSPSITTAYTKAATGNVEKQSVIASARVQKSGNLPLVSGGNQPDHDSNVSEKTSIVASINAIKSAKHTDSIQNTGMSIIAQQGNKQPSVSNSNSRSDSATINKNSGMEKLFAAEQRMEKTQKAKKNSTPADKKVLFNIYAATYFNYAEGSKSQFNTGAGVSTDIRLSGNFKLSTGVAIGKNTLDYNGQPTQSGILKNAVSAAPITSDANANYSNTTLGIVPLRVATTPVVSAYNVSLTGLDIPLNIKYELNPKKNDSYISAGLSSGTFITENYTYRYDNTPNAFGASSNLPDATTRRSFSRFDFARTLNFSIGMGYHISKQNRLIIEPFLKYPLSGLGSEQIKFGAGGLNLRFKFQ
jgi:hypothetical protein